MASDEGARAQVVGDRSARERILDTAYDLFSVYGIHAVGIDRIIAESRVAKMTLYRHFPSKDDLILAFLEERGRRWTHGWLETEIESLAPQPRDRSLALFDALDEWFNEPSYEGCALTRTLHEVQPGPIRQAAGRQIELVREMITPHAAQAGALDQDGLAFVLHMLALGAMVLAMRGDLDAARRARRAAALLLDAAR